MDDFITAIFFFGIPLVGGLWAVHSKIKKYGWGGFKKKVQDSFFEFLHVSAWASLVIVYFLGLVLIPITSDTILQSEVLTNWFLLLYIIFGLVLWYYIVGTKRRKTKSLTAMVSADMAGIINSIRNFITSFFHGIGSVLNWMFRVLAWLLKSLWWIILLVAGIWLVIALGPLWIIAIVLVLMLLAGR